jgi:MoxR-like ATPase
MPKIVDKDIFFNAVKAVKGDVETVNRQDIAVICGAQDVDWPHWLTNDAEIRDAWGVYNLVRAKAKADGKKIEAAQTKDEKDFLDKNKAAMASSAALKVVAGTDAPVVASSEALIPERAAGYVPFGHFSDVRSIIKSRRFYPIYVTGLSGNGKTMMVEQCCAIEHRECIRVNITIETDEDDLLGGFRLVNGQTVWHDGPVVTAMERGAVLLLDEVDLGSNKMMCLQPVLEGKGIYLKKTNRLVKPAVGFNVVATANTKGKGSDDGKFIGTNVMNEAFLERFSITLEQEYPQARAESKILAAILAKAGATDNDFVDRLVTWADVVRKTYSEGGVSEIISTRRLVHICEAFVIFNNDREKAIRLCLNRFDEDTKKSFMELYKKVDEKTTTPSAPAPKKPLDKTVAF